MPSVQVVVFSNVSRGQIDRRIRSRMIIHVDDEHLRWAEALAIERRHGADGPRWIAERIGALAKAGDEKGVERFVEIARRYSRLLKAQNEGGTACS